MENDLFIDYTININNSKYLTAENNNLSTYNSLKADCSKEETTIKQLILEKKQLQEEIHILKEQYLLTLKTKETECDQILKTKETECDQNLRTKEAECDQILRTKELNFQELDKKLNDLNVMYKRIIKSLMELSCNKNNEIVKYKNILSNYRSMLHKLKNYLSNPIINNEIEIIYNDLNPKILEILSLFD